MTNDPGRTRAYLLAGMNLRFWLLSGEEELWLILAYMLHDEIDSPKLC